MRRKFDVLVAGELNPDIILSSKDLTPKFGQQEVLVEDAELTIGSSSAIFACGIARLGLNVTFIGIVGKDLFGDFMLQSLQNRGVDVANVVVDAEQKTGLGVILNRGGDRAILTYTGAIKSLKAEQVPDALLGQARHLHVGSYFLQTDLQTGLYDLFARAKRQNLTTSLDPNWDPEEKWSGIVHLLDVTDVFLPNQAEAMAITGSGSTPAAAAVLSRPGGILAIKLGPDGAMAQRGEEQAKIGGIQVEAADTVGAGDSFDAGFLYGFLNHWDLERCLKLGVACGALSTRKHGGTSAQPSLSDALQTAAGL